MDLLSKEMIGAVAQSLFDRACERAAARGHEPHHPRGTLVRSMPHSYRADYEDDATAMLKALALAQAMPFRLVDLDSLVSRLFRLAHRASTDGPDDITVDQLRREINKTAAGLAAEIEAASSSETLRRLIAASEIEPAPAPASEGSRRRLARLATMNAEHASRTTDKMGNPILDEMPRT